MCRFHAHAVHTELDRLGFADAEYVWRLDDDSHISGPIGYNPFQFMKTNRKRYVNSFIVLIWLYLCSIVAIFY